MKRGVIDIGNTRIKAAVYSESGQMEEMSFFKDLSECLDWFRSHGIDSLIQASVAQALLEAQEGFRIHSLTYRSRLPFKNLYSSPQTLGVDRIAALAGAALRFPQTAVLIFDIGTCMTIDFLNPEGEYKGGNISPGADMRLKALHEMTSRLPLVETHEEKGLMGDDTRTAIANGVMRGMQFEIDGYIEKFAKVYPDLTIVLCGGNFDRFEIPHKYKIFAAQNFVLDGLYQLLLLNED